MNEIKKLMMISVMFILPACGFNQPKGDAFREYGQPKLKTSWVVSVGHGTDRQDMRLTPVFNDGVIYTASHSGWISAVAAISGKRLWGLPVGHPLAAGVAVSNGYLVVPTADGHVFAYNLHTGHNIWHAKVGNEVLASPVIAGGNVIIRAQQGHVYSFDLAKGGLQWHYHEHAPNLLLRGDGTPLVLGSQVIVGFANGQLVSLSLGTGITLWRDVIQEAHGRNAIERLVDLDAEMAVHDGVIYVAGYQGRLKAIRAADSEVIWDRKISTFTGLSVDNNNVYVTDQKGELLAFSRKDGTLRWKQDKFARTGILTQPKLLSKPNAIVVADEQGCVHVLSREDGHFLNNKCLFKLLPPRPIGRAARHTKITPAPIVMGDRILIYTDSGELVSLRVVS